MQQVNQEVSTDLHSDTKTMVDLTIASWTVIKKDLAEEIQKRAYQIAFKMRCLYHQFYGKGWKVPNNRKTKRNSPETKSRNVKQKHLKCAP